MRRLLPLLFVLGCDADVDPTGYLEDEAFRRAALEAALWKPELRYSRGLLAGYALGDAGWSLLPEQTGEVAPFTGDDADRLIAGEALELAVAPLQAETPRTDAEWIALGRRVFFGLPMRFDAFVSWLVTRPDLWAQVGLDVEDGAARGIVKYRTVAGAVQVGITCALCHAEGGLAGRADRRIDLGLARQLFAESRGRDASIGEGWGPGRVDVSEDGVDAPFAIPDLWGVRHAEHLNHSGVLRIAGPETLAIRFETQFIKGHRLQSRPARTLTWALARFVASLEPPRVTQPAEPAGAALFATHCAGCHDPERGYGGDLVPAEVLVSDPSAAFSPTRGTGHYKVASLLAVADNAPYLHDGRVPDLASLLAEGHPFGDALPAPDQAALIRFLKTL